MNDALFLLILRGVSAAALIAFVAVLASLMQRELHATERLLSRRTEMQGELIVTHPDGRELRVQLRPVLSIGRIPQNSIVLDNGYTSAQHALITYRENQWWIEDLDSRNGTLVNGIDINEPTVISVGDEIMIGDVALKLQLA